MSTTVTLDHAITYLNTLIALDPVAIHTLITTRVLCSQRLLSHPTLQVTDDIPFGYQTSVLALINGLFGLTANHRGPITAVFTDDGARLLRFQRTDPLNPI